MICVALSEKSTSVHDDDLKTFLDDMRSLPGTVRSIGVTPSSIPGLTGQLASLGFDLYLNDPLQAASAIESIRMETRKLALLDSTHSAKSNLKTPLGPCVGEPTQPRPAKEHMELSVSTDHD